MNLLSRLRRAEDQKPLPVSTTPLNLTFWLSLLNIALLSIDLPPTSPAIHASQLMISHSEYLQPAAMIDNKQTISVIDGEEERKVGVATLNGSVSCNVIKMIMTVKC